MSEMVFDTGDDIGDISLILSLMRMRLEGIDDVGNIRDLDTHQVTSSNLEFLGQKITTIGAGLTNAEPVRLHAAGNEVAVFRAPQRRRVATLYCVAQALTSIYKDGGEVARATLLGTLDEDPELEPYMPLMDIATMFEEGPDERLMEIVKKSIYGRA